MIKKLLAGFIALLLGFFIITPVKTARPADQLDCGIWICLPGGFPAGCEPYYKRFISRIKKGKKPLVSLSSCGGGNSTSSEKYGQQFYHDCKAGFQLVERRHGRSRYDVNGTCVDQSQCEENAGRGETTRRNCKDYPATRRQKTNFVDVSIDGKKIGKFFY